MTYTRVAQLVEHGSEASGSLVQVKARVPFHGPRVWRLRHDQLECDSGPYIKRWIVETPWFSLRLHHWLHGDDHRALHDHPWAFWTLILRGSYVDVSTMEGDQERRLLGRQTLRAGQWAYRPAEYLHTVELPNGPCWSLVLTGPIVRRFQFWDLAKRRFWKSNKWIAERGKFVCQ